MPKKIIATMAAMIAMSACSPRIVPVVCDDLTRFGFEVVAESALGAGGIVYDVMSMGCGP